MGSGFEALIAWKPRWDTVDTEVDVYNIQPLSAGESG